jgi:hypothetical protein
MISASGMGVHHGRGMETAERKRMPTHSKLVGSLFHLLFDVSTAEVVSFGSVVRKYYEGIRQTKEDIRKEARNV